jgi:hypothetical protein
MDRSRFPVRLLCATVALSIICTTAIRAADTGTISGIVVDQSGMPVVDALVRVASDALPAGRTILTGVNGSYRFEYIVPGNYVVEVAAPDGSVIRRPAAVELGKDAQVDFVVGVALTESLTVSATTPAIDVRSSEASFNFKAEELNTLPLDRTYRGLFQLIPGVADNRSRIGPASGGSLQDNTYLIDGANITNPGFGYLSTEINELDIAEVNLKRAGVSAESGRTGGAIVNVVSRSGSNQLSGVGRVDWLPTGLVGKYKLPDPLTAAGIRPGTFRDPLLAAEVGPAVGIGGPVRRDSVFFYGSARYSRGVKWDRFNKISAPLPDEVRNSGEFYGKVTFVPVMSQQVNVSYRHRPSTVRNANLDATGAASVATTTDNGSGIGSANWAFFVTPRSVLNVQFLYLRENNEDVPATNLGYLPPFNPADLAAMGQYTDPAQADLRVGGNQFSSVQNYRRREFRGTFSRTVDFRASQHVVKTGVGYESGSEELNRTANGWGLLASIVQNNVPAVRARYFTPQPPQLGIGRTWSAFVQDDLTIGSRLSINAGVLFNRDEFAQRVDGSNGCPSTVVLKGGAAVYRSSGDVCTFLQFGLGDEVQPRLGVAYQTRNGAGDKVYANWARYYNMDQKSAARSLAPSRVFQTQTIFDLSGNVLSSGPLASTTGKMIDPDLAPIYTDEWLIGYATPLNGGYNLDVFYMSRAMHNFIEDLPSRMNGPAPDSGPFVAANLPCTRFAACQAADARRTYRAVTIDLRRRLTRGWMADTSYTWSRFEGDFDLDYSAVAVFNTSSFIQDGPGANVEDPNRFGPLREDRPHVFKLFSSYAVREDVTVSGALRMQSGAPWNARARDWPGAVMNYLEPAGAHRNPSWTNLDLMAAYRLPTRGRARISLEGRLLNVFDAQTRISTDAQQYLDIRTIPAPPYFAPYQVPNSFFATGNAFAPPRRLFLAVNASF